MDVIQPVFDFLKNNPSLSWVYNAGIFVLTIVILSLGTVTFAKFVACPVYNFLSRVYHFFQKVHFSMEKIVFIEKELKPNGGSTLKDSINSIKHELGEHSKYIIKIDEKHRILLNSIGLGKKGIGFFETNAAGECISVTPKYTELTGLAEEELLGFNWILAIHPDDKDQVLDEWHSCTKLRRVFRMRYRYLNRKNNEVTHIECAATPIRVKDEIVGFLGSVERIDV